MSSRRKRWISIANDVEYEAGCLKAPMMYWTAYWLGIYGGGRAYSDVIDRIAAAVSDVGRFRSYSANLLHGVVPTLAFPPSPRLCHPPLFFYCHAVSLPTYLRLWLSFSTPASLVSV